MDDLAVGDLVVEPLEVRQLEAAHRPDRRVQRLAGRRPAPLSANVRRSARSVPQHLCPIVPLTLAVLAKAHDRIMPRESAAADGRMRDRPRRMC